MAGWGPLSREHSSRGGNESGALRQWHAVWYGCHTKCRGVGKGNEEGKGAEADGQDPFVSGKECELDTEGSLLNR